MQRLLFCFTVSGTICSIRMLRGARHYLLALQVRLRASPATLQPASAHDISPAHNSSSIFSMASKGSKMQALVFKGASYIALKTA